MAELVAPFQDPEVFRISQAVAQAVLRRRGTPLLPPASAIPALP